jgi:ApaG protein
MQMLDMETPTSYALMTRKIEVTVEPVYLQRESNTEVGRHVWAYTIRITNFSDETVRLMSRHWRITDANGNLQEIQGDGVVGEQPVLKPGDEFEYTSGVPLATPSGFMVGTYQMEDAEGQPFDIEIPAFSLDSPDANALIN